MTREFPLSTVDVRPEGGRGYKETVIPNSDTCTAKFPAPIAKAKLFHIQNHVDAYDYHLGKLEALQTNRPI